MPEKLIGKFKKSILPQWNICFWSAVIVGLIAHLYKITNWLPNWDSLVFRYDPQNMLGIGRWFLPVASAFSSYYDLPWITGLLAILLHAVGAVCICYMFGVKKNVTAALIGATVVSFPTVTSVLLYNYVADAYALSFLFATIAAVLLTGEKPKYIIAVVLITLSVGIYQAYVTVTITLLLGYLIVEVLRKDADLKALILKALKFLLTGAVGMALYYLVLTLILKISGTELLDYQGVNDATSLAGLNIGASLYTIKEAFFGFFFDFSKGLTLFNCLNVLVFAAAICFYLIDIIKNKLSILKILIAAFLVAMLPIGVAVLSFINGNVDYHNLMKMGFVIFYLLFILQYEKTDDQLVKLSCIKSWTVLLVMLVVVFHQVVIANISYHKLGISYEKSYGTLVRIADRIEQTEDSENCDRILVVGALEDSQAYSADLSLDMTGTTDGYIIRADDEIVGQSVLCSALNDYCGKNYKFLAGEEKAELLKKAEISTLDNWPAENSISVIDDVIVIKLSD